MDDRSSSQISPHQVSVKLEENFGFVPTPSQENLIHALSRFLLSAKPNCLLMVKGYAGTGKTSMVNAIVKTLPNLRLKSVLLAPTGRAAKVLGSYSKRLASTIHRKIYFKQRTASGGVFFVPGRNLHTDTVFIVDEASMIGWENFTTAGGGNLLSDLFEYVYSGKNCRMIVIGDGAQLPPVGSALSPALNLDFLQREFTLTAAMCELSHVMRQAEDSGILSFATDLRKCIVDSDTEPELPLKIPMMPDIINISGDELQDVLESNFGTYGDEGAVIICRSNKRCNLFNQEIRARVFFREELVNAGDYLMAVKNNYHWMGEESKAGFIANGDIFEIMRIGKTVERYGFNFLHVTGRFVDYPDEPETELVIWTDSLAIEAAAMPDSSRDKLYRSVKKDYEHLRTSEERKKALATDPYYNAVQVKYAYAITCHKAQGGQWPVVIVDQGYLTEDMIDHEYFRWLYTAVTRATTKLYLLNFSNHLLEN